MGYQQQQQMMPGAVQMGYPQQNMMSGQMGASQQQAMMPQMMVQCLYMAMSLMTSMFQMMMGQQQGQQPGTPGAPGTPGTPGTPTTPVPTQIPKVDIKDGKAVQAALTQMAGKGTASKTLPNLLKAKPDSADGPKLLTQITGQMKTDGISSAQIQAFSLLYNMNQLYATTTGLSKQLKGMKNKKSNEYKTLNSQLSTEQNTLTNLTNQYQALVTA
jgi:hypothetical protein